MATNKQVKKPASSPALGLTHMPGPGQGVGVEVAAGGGGRVAHEGADAAPPARAPRLSLLPCEFAEAGVFKDCLLFMMSIAVCYDVTTTNDACVLKGK